MKKLSIKSKLYLQQGHGLTILLDLMKDGIGDGLILSPSNIVYDKFRKTVNKIRKINKNVLLDPQFFIARYPSTSRFKYIYDYKFFRNQLGWKDVSSRRLRLKYITRIIDFQINNGFTEIVTPSLYCDDLQDNLFPININFAEESVDYIRSKSKSLNIIVSFAINGLEFNIQENRDSFLSVLTTLPNVSSFYLRLNPNVFDVGPLRDSTLITGWLEVVYYLLQNQYNVLMGYVDQAGLLFSALGADIATGTYGNLRKFNILKWAEERSGGRKKIRYYVPNLMTCILVPDDISYLQKKNSLSEVKSLNPYSRSIFGVRDLSAFKWEEASSYKHYIATIYREITSMNKLDVRARLLYLRKKISSARELCRRLKTKGVEGFVGAVGGMDHLETWDNALKDFLDKNFR